MTESRAVTLVACFGFFALAGGLALFVGHDAVELLLVGAICGLMFEAALLHRWVHKAMDYGDHALEMVSVVSRDQRATARELAEVREVLAARARLVEAVSGPVTGPQVAVPSPPAKGPATTPAAEVLGDQADAWRSRFTFSEEGR